MAVNGRGGVRVRVRRRPPKIKLIIRCVLQWLDTQHDTQARRVYRQLHHSRDARQRRQGGSDRQTL